MNGFVAIASLVPSIAGPGLLGTHFVGAAAKGAVFLKRYKPSHSIVAHNGDVMALGGAGRLNCWGVLGRRVSKMAELDYSDAMVKAGASGATWSQKSFIAYVADRIGFLIGFLDDDMARSTKIFSMKRGVADLWEYIASVSPPAPRNEPKAQPNPTRPLYKGRHPMTDIHVCIHDDTGAAPVIRTESRPTVRPKVALICVGASNYTAIDLPKSVDMLWQARDRYPSAECRPSACSPRRESRTLSARQWLCAS